MNNVLLLERSTDLRAIYDGLYKQILTGPVGEIMTDQGIQRFVDSLFSDGIIHNMPRGCVTICVGVTMRWLLYLKQRMMFAEQRGV